MLILNLQSLLSSVGDKYDKYLNSGGSEVSMSVIMIYVITSFYIYYKSKNCKSLDPFWVISLLALVLCLAATVDYTLHRLSLYFSIIACISIAYIAKLKPMRQNQILQIVLFIYVFYWLFSIVINKTNQVVPYTSIL